VQGSIHTYHTHTHTHTPQGHTYLQIPSVIWKKNNNYSPFERTESSQTSRDKRKIISVYFKGENSIQQKWTNTRQLFHENTNSTMFLVMVHDCQGVSPRKSLTLGRKLDS
jgi:hypothetical protein